MTPLLVAVGGAAGAALRYLVDGRARALFGQRFPAGTLVVNVVGSLLLGALTGAAVAQPVAALLGTGLCGALTTYSTFGAETVRLLAERRAGAAALNVAANVVLALAAATVGYVSAA